MYLNKWPLILDHRYQNSDMFVPIHSFLALIDVETLGNLVSNFVHGGIHSDHSCIFLIPIIRSYEIIDLGQTFHTGFGRLIDPNLQFVSRSTEVWDHRSITGIHAHVCRRARADWPSEKLDSEFERSYPLGVFVRSSYLICFSTWTGAAKYALPSRCPAPPPPAARRVSTSCGV